MRLKKIYFEAKEPMDGHLNRLLNYLQEQITVARACNSPTVEMEKSWDLLAEFLKTAAGKQFDRMKLKKMSRESLLKLAYAAINTCDKNQKPIDSKQ